MKNYRRKFVVLVCRVPFYSHSVCFTSMDCSPTIFQDDQSAQQMYEYVKHNGNVKKTTKLSTGIDVTQKCMNSQARNSCHGIRVQCATNTVYVLRVCRISTYFTNTSLNLKIFWDVWGVSWFSYQLNKIFFSVTVIESFTN